MATRSYVAIKNFDNTFTNIYVHWDGYPSHNGRILWQHYRTEEALRELLSFGSRSILPTTPNNDNTYSDEPAETFENIEAWIRAADQQWAEYLYYFDTADDTWYVIGNLDNETPEPLFDVLELDLEEEIKELQAKIDDNLAENEKLQNMVDFYRAEQVRTKGEHYEVDSGASHILKCACGWRNATSAEGKKLFQEHLSDSTL